MSTSNSPMLTIVSKSFPPQVSGSAILLTNVLSSYPGSKSAVAGWSPYTKSDPAFLTPCHTRRLVFPRFLPRTYEKLKKRSPALASHCLQGSIKRMFLELGTKVVLASFPYDDFVVATFLAASKLNLPFYAHMHDLWRENTSPGTPAARFAQRWEPRIVKGATRVLCMTESMQRHYEKKYGIQTDLFPHTVSEQDCLNAPTEMRAPQMSTPTVLFVGTVSSQMNLDALKVLAAASELLPREYELIYCTPTEWEALNRIGICSSRLRVKYVSRAEVQRLESEAHVLVTPLSHKNCSLDEVHTVFSTKLVEYLLSGRPIVVFAPDGSYHAESARKNGWGYVVTQDSPLALASAIMKVVTDESLAAKLVQAALKEARSRSAKVHAERLQDWVLKDARPSAYPKEAFILNDIEASS